MAFFEDYRGQVIEIKMGFLAKLYRRAFRWGLNKKIRKRTVRVINFYGHQARRITQNPAHTPYKTGRLMKSIKWHDAVEGKVIQGFLSVNVIYGRRQEFEHSTKRFYLRRAMRTVTPMIEKELNKKKPLEKIILGVGY